MKRSNRIQISRVSIFVPAILVLLICGCNRTAPYEKVNEQDAAERISIVINSHSFNFPNGMNENHNPYLDYIEQQTKLDINVSLPPVSGYLKSLNTYISSETVPDMISITSNLWVAEQAKRNALMPLDDLIDRFGPDLKAAIPEEAWKQVRYNGHIYAIPSLSEEKGVELMYGRKDWLDKLGLQPPRTLDEYEAVIRAFTLDDPDGNGQQDTYGFTMMNYMLRSAPFFGAFGIQLTQWMERDGGLVYANIQPEAKEALAFLAMLYKEKLIDPDFPLNNNRTLSENVEKGKIGLYSATWYDTRMMIALSKKYDPNADWIPFPYPAGSNGAKGVYAKPLIQSYQVIPSGSQHAEAVIRFLNFIGGQGHSTLKLGFENQVWKRVDGNVVSDFAEHDKHLYREMYASLAETADPALLKTRLDSYGKQYRLYENLQIIENNLIPDSFTGPPTPAMELHSASLNALQDIFQKIIVGAVPLDEFDRYVELWKEGGGDEMTREVNDWYMMSRK